MGTMRILGKQIPLKCYQGQLSNQTKIVSKSSYSSVGFGFNCELLR